MRRKKKALKELDDSLIVLKSGVSKYKLLISRGGNDSLKRSGDDNKEASTR